MSPRARARLRRFVESPWSTVVVLWVYGVALLAFARWQA